MEPITNRKFTSQGCNLEQFKLLCLWRCNISRRALVLWKWVLFTCNCVFASSWVTTLKLPLTDCSRDRRDELVVGDMLLSLREDQRSILLAKHKRCKHYKVQISLSEMCIWIETVSSCVALRTKKIDIHTKCSSAKMSETFYNFCENRWCWLEISNHKQFFFYVSATRKLKASSVQTKRSVLSAISTTLAKSSASWAAMWCNCCQRSASRLNAYRSPTTAVVLR